MFVSFFFQNPPIHQHWRAYFKPTRRNMTVCYFFCLCFFMFSSIFVLFLHQGQIMYIQMLYATDRPSGMLTWNNVQYLSEKHTKKRKKQKLCMTDWDTERMEKHNTEARTKRPALVLEMESVIIFGATRCMHKQCVQSHRQPDYIAEGKTSWVQHVVF